MSERYYTQREIRDALVRNGGFHESDPRKPPGKADVLAAIAMAETPVFERPGYSNFDRQGDLERVGEYSGGGKHYGPSVTSFQIRTFLEDTELQLKTVRDLHFILQDLDTAAWAALEIQGRSGYSAWTTYTSGRYLAYLQEFYPPPDGVYLVVAGDTFYRIDAKLGLIRGQMQAWNPGVDPRKLYSGLQLRLGYVQRTVVPGNTLHYLMKTAGWPGDIAKADYDRVAAFAGIPNTFLIVPGRTYRILKPGFYSI